MTKKQADWELAFGPAVRVKDSAVLPVDEHSHLFIETLPVSLVWTLSETPSGQVLRPGVGYQDAVGYIVGSLPYSIKDYREWMCVEWDGKPLLDDELEIRNVFCEGDDIDGNLIRRPVFNAKANARFSAEPQPDRTRVFGL